MKKYMLAFCAAMTACSLMAMIASAEDGKNRLSAEIGQEETAQSSGITMEMEYQVYEKNVPWISFKIMNATGEDAFYSEAYQLERYDNGSWETVSMDGMFHDIAYSLPANSEKGGQITFANLEKELSNGTYRLVKEINGQTCYASFEIGDSLVTASTPYGFLPYSQLSKGYTEKEALKNHDIVIAKGGKKNTKQWKEFIDKVALGIPAMIRVSDFTQEKGPLVTDIAYQVGSKSCFLYRQYIPGASSQEDFDKSAIYSFLIADDHHVYLSNYPSYALSSAGSIKSKTENIQILADGDISEGKYVLERVEELSKWFVSGNLTTYQVFSPDGKTCGMLSGNPLAFGYDTGMWGEIIDISDRKGIVTKIDQLKWLDNDRIALICSTQIGLKYISVFDVKKQEVVAEEYTNDTISALLRNNYYQIK